VDDRERVVALLERHGWNATSFQILEPGFRYWFDGNASVRARAARVSRSSRAVDREP